MDEKRFPLNPNQRNRVVAVESDKVDFKGKNVTKEKARHFAIKGSIYQEDITIPNICIKTELPNTRTEMRPSYKEKETNLQ